jgi:diketogulonate reductase-like aldo/keto reductase
LLEHNYIGAVIIGARMWISEHFEENRKVFGFRLDEDDIEMIEKVLEKCRAREVMDEMGDCGSEYRT